MIQQLDLTYTSRIIQRIILDKQVYASGFALPMPSRSPNTNAAEIPYLNTARHSDKIR